MEGVITVKKRWLAALCLLAGVMLLGHIVGSYDLDQVLAAGDQIRAHSLYPVMLALVLMDQALRHRAQCGDVVPPLSPVPALSPGATGSIPSPL